MTDKVQKIREEVERLKRWNNNVRNSTRHMTLQEEDFNRGKHSSYLEILNFIDSLQEEHVSGDLEEAATKYSSCAYLEEVLSDDDKEVLKDRLKNTFKAGVEWYKNTKRSNENLDEAAWLYYDRNKPITPPGLVLHREFISFFKAGAEWKEEQMMAKAIDATCFGFQDAALFSFRLPTSSYLIGSKVKVIVIKEG